MELRCLLGHGASGSIESMAPFVEGLRARGVTADAIGLPKRKAEDALPAFDEVVPLAAARWGWPDIHCPVLLLSGESDPFATIALLRAAVPTLGGPAELVTYPRLGHTLKPVLEDALDRAAAFVRTLA